MCNKENDYLSTIKVFLNNLPKGDQRIFKIRYSNAFYIAVCGQCKWLKNSYKVIDFTKMFEDRFSYEINPVQRKKEFFISFFKDLIGFVPILGSYFSLASMLYDFSEYKVSQQDLLYLKQSLKLSMTPRKKYRKLLNIIMVDSVEQLSSEQMLYLHFLTYTIEQKYLTQTAVLVMEPISFSSTITPKPCCVCRLDIHDFDKILYNDILYDLTDTNKIVLDIIHIERIADAKAIQSENAELIVAQVVQEMINFAQLNESDGIYPFLKLCSFLFDTFNTNDVSKISALTKLSLEKHLNYALKTTLINQQRYLHKFSFLEEKIREYFQTDMQIFESSVYQKIYCYLSNTYPTQYADLALISNVLQSDNGVTESNYIIAFYHQSWTMPGYKLNSVRKYMADNECARLVLLLNDAYVNTPEKLPDYKDNAYYLLDLLQNTKLSIKAKSAALSYAARVLYEVEKDKSKLNAIEKIYRDYIGQIVDFKTADCMVFRYLLDYICFSTAIEDDPAVMRLVQRYTAYLKKCDTNKIDRIDYIKFLRLGNAIYPTDSSKALEMTEAAYRFKDNIAENVLSTINYSVSLCLNGRYDLARCITKESVSYSNPINTLSIDNNFLVAACLGKYKKPVSVAKSFNKLIIQAAGIDSSDLIIVKNNYIAACIAAKIKINIDEQVYSACGLDDYHCFFRDTNLLAKAYFAHDLIEFEVIHNNLKVPGLLLGYKDFFSKKTLFMREHFDNQWDYDELDAALHEWSIAYNMDKETFYSHPVVYGLIERWFE